MTGNKIRLCITFDVELVNKIDATRGIVPRSAYIREVLEKKIESFGGVVTI